MAGYSATPLAAKLGIRTGTRLLAIGVPSNYPEFLDRLPEGVVLARRASKEVDIAHVFATRKSALGATLRTCRERLRHDAAVWVSWPKKASKMSTDITEDTVRELALPLGFVDIKVCAITDVWSGLKLVVRKELRRQA